MVTKLRYISPEVRASRKVPWLPPRSAISTPPPRTRIRECPHCGGRVPRRRGGGIARKWCSEACRVAAYRTRKLADTEQEG